MFITLKPLSERKVTADQVIARLRRKLAVVPGATLFMQSAQDLQIGGRMGNAQFQYTLAGRESRRPEHLGAAADAELRTLPQLRDVNTDQQTHGLQASVIIDRDTASRLGITAAAIDEALYDAFGQRQVSTMYRALNQYHVVMEVDPSFSAEPEALSYIYVARRTGRMVPLSFLRTFRAVKHGAGSQSPGAVSRRSRYRSISRRECRSGSATRIVQNAEREIGLPSRSIRASKGRPPRSRIPLESNPYLSWRRWSTVYIVLGMLYESYIHPITILSTLPSAGVGAILALLITHTELTSSH